MHKICIKDMHKILIAFLICTPRFSFLSGIKMVNTEYYYYVNSLSTRSFNLVLGIEILAIDHFQQFFGFFWDTLLNHWFTYCVLNLDLFSVYPWEYTIMKFAANLNLKEHQFFYSPCSRTKTNSKEKNIISALST